MLELRSSLEVMKSPSRPPKIFYVRKALKNKVNQFDVMEHLTLFQVDPHAPAYGADIAPRGLEKEGG
jgi:hypothetical protein